MASNVSRFLRRPSHLIGLRACSRHGACILTLRTQKSAFASTRSLQTSVSTRNEAPPERNTAQDALEKAAASPHDEEYKGPLTQTFRRLKIFSLGSLTLTAVMSPFIFLMETASAVPLAGRVALAGTVLVTSSISTALVGWLGKPYVTSLRWLPAESSGAMPSQAAGKQAIGIEMTTMSLTLQKRITRVYDTAFLVPSNRPLAKWELAEVFKLPAKEVEAENRQGSLPRDETIAETVDKNGNYLGWWLVTWEKDGTGTCRPAGRIERCASVV